MSYASEVIADNPYWYWKLDEASGDGGDSAPTPHGTLILAGGPTHGVAGAFPGSGTAVQFDGVNDTGQDAAGDLSAFTVATFECFLWWDAYATDGHEAAEYGSNHPVTSGFFLIPNGAGGTFKIGLGGSFREWSDTFARPTAGAWHHYALVFDRATPVNKAYVDGVAVSLTTDTHTAFAYGGYGTELLQVMSHAGASLFGAGRLQHVAVYGSELSAGRVAAHYAAAFPAVAGGGLTTRGVGHRGPRARTRRPSPVLAARPVLLDA